MPIDSSIYFQQQTPDFLGSVEKGLSMRDMLQKQAAQKQALEQQSTMRDLMRASTKIGPDGQVTTDRAKLLGGLNQAGMTDKALEYSKAFNIEDAEHRKALSDSLELLGQYAAPVKDQQSYSDFRQRALKENLASENTLPEQYDPNYLAGVRNMSMKWKDQLGQSNADRTDQREREKIANQRQDVQAKREANAIAKGGQSLQQVQTLLESARGNPEVSQALKDRYAAKKFESLANLYGDPNKLNPQQVMLAAQEVSKIASGSVPTQSELQHMTPNSIPGTLAGVAQVFMNHPTPANQGAFIKALSDYTNSLSGDAEGVIKDKYSRIIETRRKSLGEENYQNLHDQYVKPLERTSHASKAKPATVIQNGHTYNLNPTTGEYE